MNPRLSRRQFLRGTAAAAGLGLASQVFAPPHILGQRSPNSKLNTVVIGCANQGLASLSAAVTENLVAIVDVDENHLATTNNWFKEYAPDVNPSKLKVFYDYRKMFDEMQKSIDAVFVAAPGPSSKTVASDVATGISVSPSFTYDTIVVPGQRPEQGLSGNGTRKPQLWLEAVPTLPQPAGKLVRY